MKITQKEVNKRKENDNKEKKSSYKLRMEKKEDFEERMDLSEQNFDRWNTYHP